MTQARLEVTKLFETVSLYYSPDSLTIGISTRNKDTGERGRVVIKEDEEESNVLCDFLSKMLAKPLIRTESPYDYISSNDDGLVVCGELIPHGLHMKEVRDRVSNILEKL